MRTYFFAAFSLLLLACSSPSTQVTEASPVAVDYTQYVNPFIGTQDEGHSFPGATVPLGMVQASPESYTQHYQGYEGEHVAGYSYKDPYLLGFTQDHINGAGCAALSDILLMPYCDRTIDPSVRENFKSSFDKSTEQAHPNYYSVLLKDNHVKVELTTGKHFAYHRYQYKNPQTAELLVDLQFGVACHSKGPYDNIGGASQQFEDAYTLTGYRQIFDWANRKEFYVIQFSKKIKHTETLAAPSEKEKAPRYVLNFDMGKDSTLEVMIGLSTTSIENAKKNLAAEQMGWGKFDEVREQGRREWNDLFSKIAIHTSPEKMVGFYTSFYHLYIQPNNIADVNGAFRAQNDSVYQSSAGKFYSTLSLWDTYRAANPLYTILTPDLSSDLCASMMDSYTHLVTDPKNPHEANKYLPRWALWGYETHCMYGNHAIPILVDAYLKGIHIPGYSAEAVYQAIKVTATMPHHRNHVQLIDKYGYIPYDVKMSAIDDGQETVSRLLESCYDDFSAAQMAKVLGHTQDYDFFIKRSQNYKHIYDSSTGFMTAKNTKGQFRKHVNFYEVVGEWLPQADYTEGNAWHYIFSVQQDIPGVIELMGGKHAAATRLDSIFYTPRKLEVKNVSWAIYGTIGEYWHGNEPCHHLAYVYKYTDEPYKTDEIIKHVIDSLYLNTPGGLTGNDDCGQMSAWYMMSSLGFYPVNPCVGEYVLGAPQVDKACISLPNGNKFSMEAQNLSNENCYVKKVYLNGKELDRKFITHQEILAGGKLLFVMGKRGI